MMNYLLLSILVYIITSKLHLFEVKTNKSVNAHNVKQYPKILS